MDACMHKRTHTRTHTHTHRDTHMDAGHMSTYMHPRAHTHMHARTHMHACCQCILQFNSRKSAFFDLFIIIAIATGYLTALWFWQV